MGGDLPLLLDAARDAAKIAMGFWGNDPKSWTKGEGSPVTEADIAVDDFLRARLTGARPGYGWLSEETPDDSARLDADHCFIVDPIDGTRAFARAEKWWAHSIAVARGGQITAAVVYLPAADRMYAAARGEGATLNGAPVRVSGRADPEGAEVLGPSSLCKAPRWTGTAPAFNTHFRPALAWRLALVAEGRFDAVMTFGDAWEWDIAAGALLVAEAGGRATPPGRPPHSFNSETRRAPGYLAANPALHKAIGDRLA